MLTLKGHYARVTCYPQYHGSPGQHSENFRLAGEFKSIRRALPESTCKAISIYTELFVIRAQMPSEGEGHTRRSSPRRICSV